MGQSETPEMLFNLFEIYGQSPNDNMFEQLEVPFSDEEIDDVIKNLPNDKSPGPDGFNNEFIKSCWNIIEKDVKDSIHAFSMLKTSVLKA